MKAAVDELIGWDALDADKVEAQLGVLGETERAEAIKIARSVQGTFTTPSGMVTMQRLIDGFLLQSADASGNADFREGQRSVVIDIIQQIRLARGLEK